MKRGAGILTAGRLNVHPSTVSRNKERPDVRETATLVQREMSARQLLTTLNKTHDVERTNSDGGAVTGG